jgi:hypothetical protein
MAWLRTNTFNFELCCGKKKIKIKKTDLEVENLTLPREDEVDDFSSFSIFIVVYPLCCIVLTEASKCVVNVSISIVTIFQGVV